MAHVNHGRFVWHDLMSKDEDADLAFLKSLIGWTVAERDMGDMGNYAMLMAGETGVGGIIDMSKTEAVTAHWVGYVVVSDIDQALVTLAAEGGKVLSPAMPIPDVGRTAVAMDPSGAVFSLLEPATDDSMLPEGDWGPGRFCWWELVTTDPAGAQAFYGKVLGWGCHEIDMGGRPYWLWTQGEEAMNPGGLMQHPDGGAGRSHWLFYVLVDDVDASTAQVAGLGGQVLAEPMDVPGQGRMSVIATPSGAAMALFKSAGN
ncbi:MAG: VOC family protein [Ardenticatenia bacterium]|nr:VOC family protein [Ardenticatenia bacterium]